jgi:hypothetical protein
MCCARSRSTRRVAGAGDPLGTDRLRGLDVLLDHGPQDRGLAFVQIRRIHRLHRSHRSHRTSTPRTGIRPARDADRQVLGGRGQFDGMNDLQGRPHRTLGSSSAPGCSGDAPGDCSSVIARGDRACTRKAVTGPAQHTGRDRPLRSRSARQCPQLIGRSRAAAGGCSRRGSLSVREVHGASLECTVRGGQVTRAASSRGGLGGGDTTRCRPHG